jgi:hypothetical protein
MYGWHGWRSYKGLGHSVEQGEIDDVLAYLTRVLPPRSAKKEL